MDNKIEFGKITAKDVPSLYELALENGGNKDFTLNNFTHWYLSNPTQSNSMWKVLQNEEIEGYATTNNFIYTINGKDNLVALPQNVLTSEKIRGKGLFGKLYFKTEDENLNLNNVDFFLTSTGGMSTPIFLQKFGYLRALCPDIVAILPSPLKIFSPKKYRLIDSLKTIQFNDVFNLKNSRKKDLEYFKWRYSNIDRRLLKILEVSDAGSILGYAFLVVQKKYGIKTLILADILSDKEENILSIIEACHVYTSKNLFFALLMFKLTLKNNKQRFQLSIKNKFNFLVKGKTEKETLELSYLPLNFFFGDLDYFW